MAMQITHVGFSDESNRNVGRFRSLSLVTTSLVHLNELEERLKALLSESGVSEFKWTKLRGARERFAAQKMCNFAIEKACAGQLRVDVLIWDIQDSRHKIVGRDDIANLQRMYYHLFRNVLRLRWPDDAVWRLYPDEHTAMDWQAVEDFLERTSAGVEIEHSLFRPGRFRIRLKKEFGLEEIAPARSAERPLLQLADLFAGIAVFSREKFQYYRAWLEIQFPQSRLWEDGSGSNPSGRDKERFEVLKAFDEACKARRLGVSLATKCGLWTPNPENALNFWMYEPQHPEDKAPVRR